MDRGARLEGPSTDVPPHSTISESRHTRLDAAQLAARIDGLTAFVGGILFELDRHGQYLDVWTGEPELLTRPAADLYGRTLEEILGREMAAPFLEMFERVIATGVPEGLDYTLDVRAGRRTFRCQARRTPVPSGAPERETVTLLVRDVTEEMALRAKLIEAERFAAMGLLAASISHEIRQPLAFATTSVAVLARELARKDGAGAHGGSHAMEALEHVRDAVRRIGAIAASVGVMAPDRQRDTTTDVRRPTLAAVDLCASELSGCARVTVSLPDLPLVRINEGELCQVIVNLVLNAAQAGGAETEPIAIGAVLVDGGAHIRLSVTDRGLGIDPAHVDRIFDPFFTTKAPGNGSGLGLFVTKRLVEAAGGTLAIDSQPGEGTTVHVTLPVAIGEVAPASVQPKPGGRRLSVLVVDDEPAFLRSLELVLEESHDIVVCARSADALELVRADLTRFDAILCDLAMPDIDGVAFHGHLEALGVADRFVLVTAGAFTPRGEAFLREANCRRIAKPFPLDKLLAILEPA